MVSETLILIVLIAWVTAASCQVVFPAKLQNSVFKSSSSETYVFTTNTVSYRDTATPLTLLMTLAGNKDDYYFVRYTTAPGMEAFTCYKYEAPADNFYRFIDYSRTNASFPQGSTQTFQTVCDTSITVTPERRLAAVKQNSQVQGNACPDDIRGVYSYVLVYKGNTMCTGLKPEVDTCGNQLEFDTSKCPAAMQYFNKTAANPLRLFQCVLADPSVGGLNYITVANPDSGLPGCIVYKKTADVLTATYRDSRCTNDQTDTSVDSTGTTTTFTNLRACSGASAIFPGLVALVAALLCNYW